MMEMLYGLGCPIWEPLAHGAIRHLKRLNSNSHSVAGANVLDTAVLEQLGNSCKLAVSLPFAGGERQ